MWTWGSWSGIGSMCNGYIVFLLWKPHNHNWAITVMDTIVTHTPKTSFARTLGCSKPYNKQQPPVMIDIFDLSKRSHQNNQNLSYESRTNYPDAKSQDKEDKAHHMHQHKFVLSSHTRIFTLCTQNHRDAQVEAICRYEDFW